MGSFIGVTGTPGTGKKSVSTLVAKALGVPCVGLNDLAKRLSSTRPADGELDVDTTLLGREIRTQFKDKVLVYGHLLPQVLSMGDVQRVVVLRCDPKVLKARLLRRGYPWPKVLENVGAELIGVVSSESFDKFPSKVVEYDTTRKTPPRSARDVAALMLGSGNGQRIDWTFNYQSARALRSLLSE